MVEASLVNGVSVEIRYNVIEVEFREVLNSPELRVGVILYNTVDIS
jgi:hypothetical protein